MHVVFFCMIVGVLCCSFFRGGGNIEFLWMALLYLSFIAVTFHLTPPLLFFQAFLYLKIYKNSSPSLYKLCSSETQFT